MSKIDDGGVAFARPATFIPDGTGFDCGSYGQSTQCRMKKFTHIYVWGNNLVRAKLKGRKCRIVRTGEKGSALYEFENGNMVVSSRRAVRKIKALKDGRE